MANSRQYVAAPAFTPAPYGLLSSLSDVIRTPTNPHWQAGVTYESICGTASTTFDDCLAVTGSGQGTPVPPSPAKADTGLDIVKRGATAFTVFGEIDCSAPGFWDRAEEIAREGFFQNEQYEVERSFWTGIAGGQTTVYPHLAASAQLLDESSILLQTAATQVSGGGVFDIVEGLGRLEAAIADCYDGVAVIHMPRSLNPAMAANMLLVSDGARYRTPNGNIVVFGAGYKGTSPSDPNGTTPTTSAWVYATGSLFIYRGNTVVIPKRDSIDRAENTVKALVERTYVVGWDCCHYAAQISLGGVVTGGTGAGA